MPDYDFNNTYQYIIARGDVQLNWLSDAITELGGTPLGGSAAAFGAIIAEATEKWAKVIKFAGIKVE